MITDKAMTVATLSEAQLAILTQRTPPQEIRYRDGGRSGTLAYVDHAYITRTLNEAFGWDWDFEVDNEELLTAKGLPFEVRVRGRLTVRVGEHTITKMQFGSQPIQMTTNDPEKPVSIGDAFKGAASDALKKCASLLGIALDLYDSDFVQQQNAKSKTVQAQTPSASDSAATSASSGKPPASPMSVVQRRKLIELYRAIHGGGEREAMEGLATIFVETFKHSAKDATYAEAAEITSQLLLAQRNK